MFCDRPHFNDPLCLVELMRVVYGASLNRWIVWRKFKLNIHNTSTRRRKWKQQIYFLSPQFLCVRPFIATVFFGCSVNVYSIRQNRSDLFSLFIYISMRMFGWFISSHSSVKPITYTSQNTTSTDGNVIPQNSINSIFRCRLFPPSSFSTAAATQRVHRKKSHWNNSCI